MKKKHLAMGSGTLWVKICDRTAHALKTGALQPIPTKGVFMEDGGIDFFVRMISNLERKNDAKARQKAKDGKVEDKTFNPFLPYEEEMFVADVSNTHVCLLNKFNVIDHHLLIVTRTFEDQESLLTKKDFDAAMACMREFKGLVFYNGGVVAGASQKHKHLQMIPLPMTQGGPDIPIESLFTGAGPEGVPDVIPGLGFMHRLVRLNQEWTLNASKGSKDLYRLYRTMLQTVGLNRSFEPEESVQSGPYNLLLTRQWMLIVPRSKEFFGSISINALGFAGALLVQNEHQMQMVKEHGGMAVLNHTAIRA